MIQKMVAIKLLLLFGVWGAAEVGAQGLSANVAQAGFAYQRWGGAGRTGVQQVSVPFTAVVPLSPRLDLDVTTGLGIAQAVEGGGRLSGRRDLRARLSWVPDRLRTSLLSAGLNLPWGKTHLNADEAEISNVLAQHVYNYRTSSYGQGWELNVGAAKAVQVGYATIIGLGAGYLIKGQFVPLAADGIAPVQGGQRYNPGDELNLTLGLDRRILRGDGKIVVDLAYTRYGTDQRDGVDLFKPGDKLLVQTLLLTYGAGWDWRGRFTIRARRQSAVYLSSNNASRQSVRLSNGVHLEASVEGLKHYRRDLGLRTVAEVKLHGARESLDSRSGAGIQTFRQGKALVLGLGAGVVKSGVGWAWASRLVDLEIMPKVFVGRLDGGHIRGVDVSGYIRLR